MYARRTSGSTPSYALSQYAWSANIGGYGYSGTHDMDLRYSSSILIASGVTGYIGHNGDGYLTLSFSGAMGPASIFGSASASGAISANRIAKAPYTPPQPTLLSVTASTLNFTIQPPADNGGSAILDYTLDLATDTAFTSVVQTRISSASAQTFTGLDPALNYYLQHRARNAVGTGPNSPYRLGTTAASVPGAPTGLNVPAPNPTGGTLQWTAPAFDGGAALTGYRITRARSLDFTQEQIQYTQGPAISRVFADMLPSTKYYLKVAAGNVVGYSTDSAVLEFTTVSGVYYSTGSAWLSVGVFDASVPSGGPAELFVSDGTNWIAAI